MYAKEKKRKRKMLTNVVTVLKLEIEIFRLSVKRLRYTTSGVAAASSEVPLMFRKRWLN